MDREVQPQRRKNLGVIPADTDPTRYAVITYNAGGFALARYGGDLHSNGAVLVC
jgi:hypothetical protein